MTESINIKKSKTTTLPQGTLFLPLLLCSLAGNLSALLLHLLNQLEDKTIVPALQKTNILPENFTNIHFSTQFLTALIFSAVFSFILLDSAFWWRRLLLIIAAMGLSVGAWFTFALWGIFAPPWYYLISFSLSCALTLIYTALHLMPCEMHRVKSPKPPKISTKKEKKEKKDNSSTTPIPAIQQKSSKEN